MIPPRFTPGQLVVTTMPYGLRRSRESADVDPEDIPEGTPVLVVAVERIVYSGGVSNSWDYCVLGPTGVGWTYGEQLLRSADDDGSLRR